MGETAGAFLALRNAEGAQGYRYLSDLVFAGHGGAYAFMVKDAETTYGYELLTSPATAQAWEAQANAQGARGFQFAGIFSQGMLYRRNNAAPSSFSYAIRASQPTAAKSSAYFLKLANELGANGYRHIVEYAPQAEGTAAFHLYERQLDRPAVYQYEVLGPPGSDEGFLAVLNAQGQRGLRYQTPYVFPADGGGIQHIYVKDSAQASKFTVQMRDQPAAPEGLLEQANSQGATGGQWLGVYALHGPVARQFYFQAESCEGPLCLGRGPFGF